ncbi:putative MATE family efflux protein [Catenibacillus scindens]|uniref:Multidrug export protein MepA n=1 Tax=Catenibacillus scindens TaxID=673271 RepID=A0A7W8M5B0_9FIRM|nr:MATE family efflux transporter [Catenibacillus scindens]MBB5264337.1 putative MATE family efflux protein [Catenibacillus scindens]
MEQTMIKNPLGYEKIPKLLKSFAIPSIIAMLVSSLYNIVDQIFIGQGVGYLGNAATNVSYPLTTICLAIALLIGIGSASNFSLSLGGGDKEKAAKITGNAVCMMLMFGIIYAVVIEIFLLPMLNAFGSTPDVLPYAQSYTRITAIGMPLLIVTNGISNLARADGSPKYSMTCMLIGAVINTILDPVFIFVFHQGVAGAAWATVIGQFFSFLFALRYLRKFKSVELKREHFRLNLRLCLTTVTLGMSNSLNQVALTVVQIVMNNSLTYYGAMSVYGKEIPLAACGIVMKTNAILLAVIIGISQGSQPIVGFNYGAKQYQRVKDTYKLAIVCNLVVSAIGFILFQFFPRQIISLFGTGDEAYFEFSVKFMRIFLFMVIANGVQLISSNFFSAIGKPLKGMILSLTRQVFFLIPLILIIPLFMGIDGIMFAGPVADTMAFIATVVLISFEMRLISRMQAQQKAGSSTV